jgi:thymidylate kinase
VLLERSPDCEVFMRLAEARGELGWLESAALREAAAALGGAGGRPAGTVYLRAPPALCDARIRGRARGEEVADPEMGGVLAALTALHEDMFSRADLVLDAGLSTEEHRGALERLLRGLL